MHKLNNGLVLVKVDEPKEQDDTGVFVQEEWQTRPPEGEVIAVADDVTFCKVGDRIFFERYTSIPTPHGENMRMCRESAVFEVLDGKA